jgi:hypothetical protein
MKRLTNLREIARKKIFSYLKMGIITTFPDNSRRYISINRNEVEIKKVMGGHIDFNPENATEYQVSTTFTVFTLRDDGMLDAEVGKNSICLYLPDIAGIDLYSRIYEEIKLSLHNHTDDAIARIQGPVIVNVEE